MNFNLEFKGIEDLEVNVDFYYKKVDEMPTELGYYLTHSVIDCDVIDLIHDEYQEELDGLVLAYLRSEGVKEIRI